MADNDVTRIAGNIGAMNALNALTVINKQLSVHQSRLATGKRINTAADDPAGLTIATKMLARSEGLKVSLTNIADAKNLLAVAESGLGRINDILVQMRNKAEAGASDTMGSAERGALVDQMTAYAAQIDDVVKQTKWTSSGSSLIGGAYAEGVGSLTFQTGADNGNTTTLTGLSNVSASGVGSLNIATSTTSATGSISNNSVVTVAGAAKSNDNLAELSSGSYRVTVEYGAAKTNGATIKLYAQGSSSAMMVDADNAGGTELLDSKAVITTDLTGAGTVAVDLGNGVSVTVSEAAFSAGGTVTGYFDYARSGETYALRVSDTGSGSAGALTKDSSAKAFANYMADINGQLDIVSGQLAKIGSMNGRLTFKEDQISAAQINTEGAYNRIMNANMAEEQVNASKFLILQQTATAMLAQANAAPQFLLSLFR